MLSIKTRLKSKYLNKDFLKSFQQISFFSGGSFFAQIVMMLYAILVARALLPEQLGIYSGLYAILGVTVTVVSFGFDVWMLKEHHNYDSIRKLTGEVISIKLVLGSLWGLICITTLSVTHRNHFTPLLISLAIFDVICDNIFNTISTAWNISRKISLINTMLISSRLGKLILLLGIIYFNLTSPITIIFTRMITSAIILVICIIKLNPVLNMRVIKDIPKVIKRSAEYGLSEILAVIYGNIDVAILTFFSITNTGLYSPASGIIHALFIIPNSFYVYLLPKFSKLIATEPNFQLRNILRQILIIFSTVGVVLSLGLFIGGEYILTFLLGPNYLVTGKLLTILSPIMLFKSLAFGFALIIIITGQQKRRLIPQLFVSLANLILNLILIPYFGLPGVAWIYSISEALLMLGYYLIVRKQIKNEKKKQI
jgi:O-antigen/teichoic acid export membrane protein